MIIILYSILFLLNFFGNATSKKLSKTFSTPLGYCIYLSICSVFASFLFYISSGFNIVLNRQVLIYSVVYAMSCTFSTILNLVCLMYFNLGKLTVIRSALTLIITFTSGAIIFNEKIGFIDILRCILMVCASILLFDFKSTKDNESTTNKRNSIISFCIVILSSLLGTAGSLISKSFANDLSKGLVTDSNSWFFMTNIFTLIFILIIFPVMLIKDKKSFKDEFKALTKPKKCSLIFFSTLISNLSSLVTIPILTVVNVSLNTPIASAIGILAAFAAGAIFYREKIKPLPIIIALCSIFLVLV